MVKLKKPITLEVNIGKGLAETRTLTEIPIVTKHMGELKDSKDQHFQHHINMKELLLNDMDIPRVVNLIDTDDLTRK